MIKNKRENKFANMENYKNIKKNNIKMLSVQNMAITLITLVITILLSYDDIRKYSNSSKFLLPINC